LRNIKLILEYDGTNYHGWQKQKNGFTVQQIIEDKLSMIMKEKIDVIGCGRTDAGVHAINYTCNFHTSNSISINKIPLAINCLISDDIRILDAKEVDKSFHARYNAKKKTYIYKIYNDTFLPVFKRNYYYHFPYQLNLNSMIKGSRYFLGKHDFKAFMAAGSQVKDTVRNIKSLDIISEDKEVMIRITADGFLYNMVRIIVGTLLYLGNKKIMAEEIPLIIESGIRQRAGITVPAKGLYLEKVYY
jgi:tRNA pseudouridine38-40 synthase